MPKNRAPTPFVQRADSLTYTSQDFSTPRALNNHLDKVRNGPCKVLIP